MAQFFSVIGRTCLLTDPNFFTLSERSQYICIYVYVCVYMYVHIYILKLCLVTNTLAFELI